MKKKRKKKQIEALEVLKHNTLKLTIKDSIRKKKLTKKANKLNRIKEIVKNGGRRKFSL